jgi:cysteine-rich repeat protein
MQITSFITKTVTVCLLLATPIACSMGGSSDQAALSGNKNGSGSGSDDCTLTQGYWKNHPDAWPVDSLKLGAVTYTKVELIATLKTPVKGNGLIALAHQLIAAKLNVAAGAPDASVKAAIEQSDTLIASLVIPPKGEATIETTTTASLVAKLDAFNNGDIGPGHCGDNDDDDDGDCDHDDDGHCDEDCDHDDDGDCDGDDETCDHDTDGDGTCDHPTCGNTMVELGETCDDGNTTSGDGCSSTCTVEPHSCVCGDGVQDLTEACDDGNTTSGDGCSSTCTIELPVCGNGVIENGETCDDGNTNNGDGCSSVCICEPCIP